MQVVLRIVTVALLVLTLGLHWALLQTVAWTGMLLANTRGSTLRVAVQRTFDGQHPCALCLIIKQSRKQEGQSDTATSILIAKPDLALPWQLPVLIHCARPNPSAFPSVRRGLTRPEEPPKPRPRGPAGALGRA